MAQHVSLNILFPKHRGKEEELRALGSKSSIARSAKTTGTFEFQVHTSKCKPLFICDIHQLYGQCYMN